ncbi:MAG: hypothetical protein IAF94_11650 [Pirellulaceae bacterium]|nr:hypothetical protein [Pirellulaceae bacterium]
MTEIEWSKSTDPIKMLASLQNPTDRDLSTFSLACLRRIWALITDPRSIAAIEALEKSAGTKVPEDIALAASNVGTTSDFEPSTNFSAARAVLHAVSFSLPPQNYWYNGDRKKIARDVTFYAQLAVAATVRPLQSSHKQTNDSHSDWLMSEMERAEASAQCDEIRTIFVTPIN